MQVNHFFINFTLKTKESQWNVNIKKVLFCVCHLHAHDF